MIHRGGLSLSIIIWRIRGEGPSFLLSWDPEILLTALLSVTDISKLKVMKMTLGQSVIP
jgi:hypothetical protein